MEKKKSFKTKINGVVGEVVIETRNGGNTILATNSVVDNKGSHTNINYFNKCMVCGEYCVSNRVDGKHICKSCETLLRDRFALVDAVKKVEEPKVAVYLTKKKRKADPNFICTCSKKTKFVKYIEKNPSTIKIQDYEKRNVKYISRSMAEKLFELIIKGIDTKNALVEETGLKVSTIETYMKYLNNSKLAYYNARLQKYFTYNNVPIIVERI